MHVIAFQLGHTATPRAGRWLPLWLSVAALTIAGLSMFLWQARHEIKARYHYFRIAESLDAQNSSNAFAHLSALLRLPPDVSIPLLQKSKTWPTLQRQWLSAQIADQNYDENGLQVPSPNNYLAFPGLVNLGEPEEKPFIDLAYAIDGENVKALQRRAFLSMRERNYRAAAESFEQMILCAKAARSDGDWMDYFLYGEVCDRLQRYEQAEKAYRYAIRMMPQNPDLYRALAITLESQGKYCEAIRTLCDFMVNRPAEAAELLLWRARLFAMLGHYDLGKQDIGAAVMRGTEASDDELHLEWAATLARTGKLKEGLAEFDRLLKAGVPAAEVRQYRVSVPNHPLTYAQKIEDYQYLLLNHPKNPIMLNNLAWMYATATVDEFQDPAQSLALAKRAHELDKGQSPFIIDTLAEAYFINGDFAQALQLELTAENRGGEVYQKVIDRYRQALEAKEQGEAPALTPHPLLASEKPPPPADGTNLDLKSLPTAPRVSSIGYENAYFRSNGDIVTLDLQARYMANAWLGMPAAAIDDPRVDMLLICKTLRATDTLRYRGHNMLPEEDDFLAGLVHGLNPKQAEFDGERASTSYDYGRRAGRVMRTMKREEVGRILKWMTAETFTLSECLPMTYTLLGKLTQAQEAAYEREWIRIEARLRHAGSGENISPAPERRKRLERITPRDPNTITPTIHDIDRGAPILEAPDAVFEGF